MKKMKKKNEKLSNGIKKQYTKNAEKELSFS